uniref:Mitotic checkpoint serine/threonine-protein kinase BUB1 beta n=3 Tax=Cacopsylla melanoneura TaxID=428564 RepID=A0A8D9E181_9HEMI
MMDASEVLDLSKENVQPLVHGRKADKLSKALQANSNFQLQQELKRQREEFELQIRMDDGDDPLQLRFDYVQWLEQSYPSLGPETNIIPFLEETLVAFKNNDQYKQDPRYVSLVIKYIQTQPNPLEIYNLVYSENIGTKLAIFYRAWAEELDSHNDIKQANHVFQLGLNARAEPIEELEAAQM